MKSKKNKVIDEDGEYRDEYIEKVRRWIIAIEEDFIRAHEEIDRGDVSGAINRFIKTGHTAGYLAEDLREERLSAFSSYRS